MSAGSRGRSEGTFAGAAPETPSQLGRYELLYRIGAGGMADVYLAREKGAGGLERWVAIKQMHRHLAAQAQFIEMLLDEARLAGRIAHPNVAQLLEIGEADGVPFIVMEYLHGEPLSYVIRRAIKADGVPPIDVMVRVLAWACEGAHAAHELRGPDGQYLGLVHRDLSPQNIFITYDGSVKVVDFGVAKARGRSTMTEPGTLKGKFSYMSPEQARGLDIDRRSDVFALGAVLYKATTGLKAFGEEADLVVLARVQRAQYEAPAKLRRDYPLELQAILNRALAPTCESRFATAREFGEALERFLVERRVMAGPSQIAALMKRLFSDRIRSRDAMLAHDGAASLDLPVELEESAESPLPRLDSAERSKSGVSVRAAMEVEGEPAPLSVMTPAPLPPARDPDDPSVVSTWGSHTESSFAGRSASSGRRILIASLILCLALGLGILLFALQPEPQSASPSVPAPSPPTTSGLPAPSAPVPVPPPPAPPIAPAPEALPPPTTPAPPVAVAEPVEPAAVDPAPVEVATPGEAPSGPETGVAAPPTTEAPAAPTSSAPGTTRPRQGRHDRSDTSATGVLNVRSQPWSNVFVDGQRVRPTPLVGHRIPVGRHTIRLVTQDGRSATRRVNVTSNRPALVDVRF